MAGGSLKNNAIVTGNLCSAHKTVSLSGDCAAGQRTLSHYGDGARAVNSCAPERTASNNQTVFRRIPLDSRRHLIIKVFRANTRPTYPFLEL
jgi:hypothetical protein